jgi:CheY-like chemotaxis protein
MRVPSRKVPCETQILLLVEDEVLVRWMLADYLRQCGYQVMEAANAAEAMAVLETSQPINLMLSDVQMPGEMDGFGLARWVLANRPDTKVILTSGVTHSVELARELCVDAPIEAKPYDPQRLRERIRSALA